MLFQFTTTKKFLLRFENYALILVRSVILILCIAFFDVQL
jgi:hypothetical protein